MAPEQNKNDDTSNDHEKHKNIDQEIRELISALTSRLSSIHRSQKPGSSTTHINQDDNDQGVGIITLAGSNSGATMRGDMDDKSLTEDDDSGSYLVNSNFQAINNSIMLGGSYKTNDPGVHLDITDYFDQNEVAKNGKNKERKNKKGSHKSDHHHSENQTS